MMSTDEVVARWEARRLEWARLHAVVDGATIAAEVIEDLRSIVRARALDILSLSEAARESGYSADHLARLVREGRIPNAGRRGKPMIRRTDLPIRPRKLDGPKVPAYDPVTDARSLGSRR